MSKTKKSTTSTKKTKLTANEKRINAIISDLTENLKNSLDIDDDDKISKFVKEARTSMKLHMTPKKKVKDGPKKPRTGYNIFCAEKREEVKKKFSDKDGKSKPSDVMRELGKRWKELDEDDKKEYLDKAKEEKEKAEENKKSDDEDKNSDDDEEEEKPKTKKKAKKSSDDEEEEKPKTKKKAKKSSDDEEEEKPKKTKKKAKKSDDEDSD